MGQLPTGPPPVKAAQLQTVAVHDLLMQETRSGTYTSYGISHGQGPHEWYLLAEMDYVTLKSMLVIFRIRKRRDDYVVRILWNV